MKYEKENIQIIEKIGIENHNYYKCKCNLCGKIFISRLDHNNKSCGCIQKERVKEIGHNNKKDLTGKIFGYLKVIKDSGERQQRKVLWECECCCGKIIKVLSTNLTHDRVKSCGCKRNEEIKNYYHKKWPEVGEKILGCEIFDKKTIKDTRGYNNLYILINCPRCGEKKWINYNRFKNGDVKTCGCINDSKGVEKIKKILQEHNVPYENEKTFSTCYPRNSKYKCRFDFFINNSYLLEYDGEQHFLTGKESGFYTEEAIQKMKENDSYKNNWCKENNIPLIRIPYTKLSSLAYEDLVPETSSYLIK